MAGGELVGAVEPILVCEPLVLDLLEDGLVPPAECLSLRPPEALLIGLDLAETAFRAGVAEDVHLVLGRHAVPVEALGRRECLGLVEDLLPPLAERLSRVIGDALDDNRLLVFVVADADAETAEFVCKHSLKIGTEFLDAGVGQGLRVE